MSHGFDRENFVTGEQNHRPPASAVSMGEKHCTGEDVIVIDGPTLPRDRLFLLIRSATRQMRGSAKTMMPVKLGRLRLRKAPVIEGASSLNSLHVELSCGGLPLADHPRCSCGKGIMNKANGASRSPR